MGRAIRTSAPANRSSTRPNSDADRQADRDVLLGSETRYRSTCGRQAPYHAVRRNQAPAGCRSEVRCTFVRRERQESKVVRERARDVRAVRGLAGQHWATRGLPGRGPAYGPRPAYRPDGAGCVDLVPGVPAADARIVSESHPATARRHVRAAARARDRRTPRPRDPAGARAARMGHASDARKCPLRLVLPPR